MLRQDSNSDHRNRKWARWPPWDHYGPKPSNCFRTIYEYSQGFSFYACSKRPKINEIEAGVNPFFKRIGYYAVDSKIQSLCFGVILWIVHSVDLAVHSWNTLLLHKGTIFLLLWTSCLTGLDQQKQVYLLLIRQRQNSWIQPSKTGGQRYSNTSLKKVSEYSLVNSRNPSYAAPKNLSLLRNTFLERNVLT